MMGGVGEAGMVVEDAREAASGSVRGAGDAGAAGPPPPMMEASAEAAGPAANSEMWGEAFAIWVAGRGAAG